MCGIAGIIGEMGRLEGAEDRIHRMAESMKHRGPDDSGFYMDEQASLGFRRLSIIDLSTGHQPIFNEDGTLVIVFNGEVYNYKEIRRSLEACGHRFATKTDTEVILHAYEEYGDRCVERFLGMFAFCIWDKVGKKAFFARDRLGIKPLYFAQSGEYFLFASEVKSILSSGLVQPEADFASIGNYLTYRFCPAPETPFKGIRKLRPAHRMRHESGDTKTSRYWDLKDFRKRGESAGTIERELVARLRTAVERRLVSDVPLGLFLSGGIDSSVMLALMTELMNEPVKTFTIGFDFGNDYQEFEYAEKVARIFGAEHRSMTIGAAEFLEEVPRIIWHLDEPVADSATIPLYFISRFAKQYVTVALSGEGSDELFAGYSRLFMYDYRRHKRKKLLRQLPAFTRGPRATSIVERFFPAYLGKFDFVRNPIELDRVYSMGNYFSAEEKKRLFARRFGQKFEGEDSYEIIRELLDSYPGTDYLDRKLLVDLMYWLPDNLLIKADRASMANGIELRVPFLDHEFVEFAFTVRDDLKIREDQGKYILKKAFEKILPKEILYRRKMGFPVPIAEWFRGILKENLREVLLGEKTCRRGIFRPEVVLEMINRHVSGEKNLSGHLWILYVFEIWCRIFLDGEDFPSIRLHPAETA
jgi:asparagine synthase (glutamine-hydrolysing)